MTISEWQIISSIRVSWWQWQYQNDRSFPVSELDGDSDNIRMTDPVSELVGDSDNIRMTDHFQYQS